MRYNEAYFLRVHLWAKRRLGERVSAKTVDHRRAWKEISPGITFKEHIKRFNDVVINFADYVDSLVAENVINQLQFDMLVSSKPTEAGGPMHVVNATINVFGYILRITDTHIHITRDIADPYVGLGQSSPVLLEGSGGTTSLLSSEQGG